MPSRATSAPLRHRVRDATAALVAVAAVLALGLLLFGRRREPPPRPDPGDTLLATDLPLGEHGGSARFRVRRPGHVEVGVEPRDGEEDAEVSVAIGPPLPPAPDGRDLPGDGPSWTARRGDAPRRFPIFATGLYVVRVEPPSQRVGGTARVRVTMVPARMVPARDD